MLTGGEQGMAVVGGRSTHLVATYSQTNNSYETHPTGPDDHHHHHQSDNQAAATIHTIDHQNSNGNCPQLQQTTTDSRRRRSTLTDTLLSAMIKGGKSNGLLTCLLGATLFASILNTLLLSFVVKSIQLNDNGFINGKITWDQAMESTVFELPAKLFGKSISLKSIESFDDKPLELVLSADKWLSNVAVAGNQQQGVYSGERETKPFQAVFLTTNTDGKVTETTSRVAEVAQVDDFKFNYMAVNVDSGYNNGILEIGAKTLKMNLIDKVVNGQRQITTTTNSNLANKWRLDSTHRDSIGAQMVDIDNTSDGTKPLLEFNGEQQSITLALEKELNLNSLTSNSVVVNDKLKSSHITGSLEDNLNLQTRDGNLACKSEEAMRLMSKSADATITTFDELVLSAPSLILASNNLYIPNGIQYFDSEPTSSSNLKFKAHNTDLTQSPNIIGSRGGRGEEENEEGDSSSSSSSSLDSLPILRAYNLVAVNGLLMAA